MGFALIQKVLIDMFGSDEYVFRAFPCVASLASIPLFYLFARRHLTAAFVPLALALFSIVPGLIHFSSQAKQFSSDVALGLVALVAYGPLLSSHSGVRLGRVLIAGVGGAVALWFSHPLIFILAGLGLASIVAPITQRAWGTLTKLGVAGVLWLGSFVALFTFWSSEVHGHEDLHEFWQHGFLPFPPRSPADVLRSVNLFFGLFRNPGGYSATPGIAAVLAVVGIRALFREHAREYFLAVMSPAMIALIAAALALYPFRDRPALFLVPIIVLLITLGVQSLHEHLRGVMPSLSILLVLLLLTHPLLQAGRTAIRPDEGGVRQVAAHIRNHWQDGDVVFVFLWARPRFQYYAPRFGFRDTDWFLFGYDDMPWFPDPMDVAQLQGRTRMWALFARLNSRRPISGKQVMLQLLDRMGRRVDSFASQKEAEVYLYDLDLTISGDAKLPDEGNSSEP